MSSQKQISQLTGIRAPAFVMIFLAHTGYNSFFMWSSVDLYFVLSGCLITGILLSQEKNDNFFRIFYTRRFLRIFPPFYVAFILSMLLLDNLSGAQTFAISMFVANIYMPFSDLSHVNTSYWALGPYWTLAVEEQFYLLWPLLVFKLRPKQLLWTCICMIVVAPILRAIGYHYLYLTHAANEQWLFMLPWNRMDLLAAGSAIAISQHLQLFQRSTMAWFGIVLMGMFATFIAVSVMLFPDFRFSGHTFYFSTFGLTYFCGFMTGLIMYLANATGGPIVKLLSLKPLMYLGTISYTMYLIHGVVITMVHERLGIQGGPQLVLFAYVVTMIVSAFSWHALELPIKNLKNAKFVAKGAN
jgi:peptidoglycan/LPS O-acetylase OafA/YrhL